MITVRLSSWDQAKTEVFRNTRVTVIGGRFHGVIIDSPVLTTLDGRPRLSGIINDKYDVVYTEGSDGFRDNAQVTFAWPLVSVVRKKTQLRVIDGEKAGRLQKWVRASTKS